MRLSFAMLAFELSCRIPLLTICGDPHKVLPAPLLFSQGMALAQEDFFIACGADLPTEPPSDFAGALLCIGELPESWKGGCHCAITVARQHSPTELYHLVREVSERFAAWEASMADIEERGGTIQELLDVSSPLFDNQLVLTDKDTKVLAGSYEGSRYTSGKYVDVVHSDMNQKNLFQATKQIAPSLLLVDLGIHMDHQQSCWRAKGQGNEWGGGQVSWLAPWQEPHQEPWQGASQEPWQDPGQESQQNDPFIILVKNIDDSSRNIAVTLAVRPINRAVGEHDIWLVEQLTTYIKRILPRDPQIKDHAEAEVLDALLRKEVPVVTGLERIYRACDFWEGNRFRCLTITKPEYFRIGINDDRFLRQRFKAVIPSACFTFFEGSFVILINDTKSGWDNTVLRAWIAAWLGDQSIPVGISNRFANLTDLREYYVEALAALSLAGTSPDGIMLFSDCRMDYVLAHCPGQLLPRRLFPAGLSRLLEFNRSTSVNYVATLRVWLDEGMNDSQAAKKLHISRNSFLYRRNRILEILNLDLRDPEIRFFLSLCLRLVQRDEVPTTFL